MNKNLIFFFDSLLRECAWDMPHTRFYDMVEINPSKDPIVIVPDEELYSEFLKIGKKLLKSKNLSDRKKAVLMKVLDTIQANENDVDLNENDLSFLNPKSFDVLNVVNNLSFTERFEIIREEMKLETLQETIDILEKIYNKEISIDNPLVWESLRTQLKRGGREPYETATNILMEYRAGVESAKRLVIDMGKDPSRGNLAEKMQKDTAKEFGVSLKKLPPIGKKSLHLLDGGVFKKEELTKEEMTRATSSLDFEVSNSNNVIYTYNKYTKQAGGSQDNIVKDVRNVITQFGDCKSVKLILILDGDFWKTKINTFLYNNENILIITSDDYNKPAVKKFLNLR